MSRPASGPKRTNYDNLEAPVGMVIDKLEFKRVEEKGEKQQRLKKEWLSFWFRDLIVPAFALLLLFVAAFYRFWVLLRKDAPEEDKQFAVSLLIPLMAGTVGYLYGNARK